MSTLPSIPLGLRHALEAGDCVLFLGAGIGAHLFRDGLPVPDAVGLAAEIGTHFALDTRSTDLAKVSQLVEIRKGRDDLIDFVRKRLANLEPDKYLQWLTSIRWRAIFTTNYDNGMERAYDLCAAPPLKPIPMASTPELVKYDSRFEVPVYHIHGALFGGRSQIVITENDYSRFREHRRMLFELLKLQFATSTILYIGYSNNDPNWKLVLDELAAEFYPSELPTSYRVAPSTDPADVEILRSKGIETIESDLAGLVEAASSQLATSTVEPDRLKQLQASIPSDLVDAFEKNPAAVARLMASWQYVNQAKFNESPNTSAFLHGDLPNWAVIGQKHHFTRDLEEILYDDVLDYATGSPTAPSRLHVLAPAGYGTSALLMSIAVRLVKERVGPVYFLRPNADVLEGDIEFATSLSKDTTCFVVDNASDTAYTLRSALTHLRNLGRPGLFICGSRLNEWRQKNVRLSGKEYPLDVLSDQEINLLLDCLAKHQKLNKLQPLSRELQISAIKVYLGKELLVTMREATEDRRFDAILEDEYQSIDDESCRELYLTVCCFYQHGAYVRDVLLAEIGGIPFADLHSKTKGFLDGVVIYDCIDETSLQYAARARHRTIAKIVWERCSTPIDKDQVLHKGLEHLNLNFKTDVSAFEKLIRNEWLIDSIRGLESKIRFFETACKKDPDSPYVRQHYARMLTREKKLDLALAQIEQALSMTGKAPPRVLYHTKGMILGQMALELDSFDIARRRLAQAEEAFRRSIQLNARDEYAYHTLSILYLNWAKRCASNVDRASSEAERAACDAESANYLARAEQVISDGLRQVKERDGLWIASAEIERWLGDEPSRLKALEKAVKETPTSVVARYLLAKAYRIQGRNDDALSALDHVIKNHPDEFRSFVEYALAMYAKGKSMKECIAVLRLSQLYGLSDARYISIYGGMLFLEQNSREAEAAFEEAQKRDLNFEEAHTIHFRPIDPRTNGQLRMTGKVIVVRPSYSLVEAQGYPHFLCQSSKYKGLAIKLGMQLSFDVAFCAKGAVALNPSAT